MKRNYYVNINAQTNGDHEVHVAGCIWMPKPESLKYVGEYETCYPAVSEAAKHFNQVNGCIHCCTPCHTQ